MTYEEYKTKRQQEFNSLPIFYAFSNSQFEEAMQERGLTSKDTDKIYRLGGGGFYLRKDADIIRAFFDKPDELPELMKDYQFAESAFYYEMQNHEYHINWQGDWDVCRCFCDCEYGEGKSYVDYLTECGYSKEIIKAFSAAKRRFFKACDDNDWW